MALFLLILSFLGAIAFSNGSILRGVFAFFIISLILAVIKGFFEKWTSTESPDRKTSNPKPKVRVLTGQEKPSVTNLVESMINTGDNKAYFDDGVVYAITRTGEYKIGYYDEKHAYDENKKEIASFTHEDDGIYIQFNHLGQIAWLEEMYADMAKKKPGSTETCQKLLQEKRAKLLTFEYAKASSQGFIEDAAGDYGNVAYLYHQSNTASKERILGMAAAFVCLQKFVWTDENRYSRFYKR